MSADNQAQEEPGPGRLKPDGMTPMDTSKEEYASIIDRISLRDSPVGIDAQLTHAIIITYLQRIEARLEALEKRLS